MKILGKFSFSLSNLTVLNTSSISIQILNIPQNGNNNSSSPSLKGNYKLFNSIFSMIIYVLENVWAKSREELPWSFHKEFTVTEDIRNYCIFFFMLPNDKIPINIQGMFCVQNRLNQYLHRHDE